MFYVVAFIRENIICRYGVPHELISDHGSHFKGEVLDLLQEYGIKHHKSSPYRPQTNGAVEAANKNVKNIIRKMTGNCKDWPSRLPFALWGYRTSIRTPTGATPYSLVYGMESVLPIKAAHESFYFSLHTDSSYYSAVAPFSATKQQPKPISSNRLQSFSLHLGH